MSPLRRQSLRLRSKQRKDTSASRRVSGPVEHEETPRKTRQALEVIGEDGTVPQTPSTALPTRPAFEEMHPGKGHSAASPSFDYRHAVTPATTGRIKPQFEEINLGKGHSTASPTVDFKFARPGPKLGPEAQKMMDELRDEALRIKAKLAAERDVQRKAEEEAEIAATATSSMAGGRKIAFPKGKVGRYSEIHMAEFKKMDSIAGHASAFRTQPGRSQPSPAPAIKSLKRSQSSAKFGEREKVEMAIPKPTTTYVTKSLKRSQSNAKLDEREGTEMSFSDILKPVTEKESSNGTPAKRARLSKGRREVVEVAEEPETPKCLSRSRSIFASLTTPTQASLARAHAAQIPALSHSPSKPNISTPQRLAKSTTMGNLSSIKKSDPSQNTTQTSTKLERMKSMLRRPYATPKKSTFASPKSAPHNNQNVEKELPALPFSMSSKMRNVNLTPRTINKNAATVQTSPRYKPGIPRSKSNMNLSGVVNYPSLSSVMNSPADAVTYPSLSGAQALITSSQKAYEATQAQPPSVPGTFTFRSDKTISFGTSPNGFGSSPGQSSLRHVRPSIFPGSMPGAFPLNNRDSDKENDIHVLSIPHGMPNKKRRRADSEDVCEEAELERSPKKHKGLNGPESTQQFEANPVKLAVEREKLAPKSRIPSPAKKGVLSLSRLNMLARPKMRK